MFMTCPIPIAFQKNTDKYSAPLRQNQYNLKPHTSPDKRSARAKSNPRPDNKQAPQVSQYKNNCKNTSSLDLSYSSIYGAVLWQLLIKTRYSSHKIKKPRSQGTLGNTFNALDFTRTLQKVCPVSSKC